MQPLPIKYEGKDKYNFGADMYRVDCSSLSDDNIYILMQENVKVNLLILNFLKKCHFLIRSNKN